MVDNIEKVLERGEKIELLVDKSENLRDRVSHPAKFCLPDLLYVSILQDCGAFFT